MLNTNFAAIDNVDFLWMLFDIPFSVHTKSMYRPPLIE
jgi:hypothetical protein